MVLDYLCASLQREEDMQSESAIFEITKRKGYHVEKLDRDRYRLINDKLRAVMYLFDSVPLETIVSHFEEGASK
jgi:hypothetical protein